MLTLLWFLFGSFLGFFLGWQFHAGHIEENSYRKRFDYPDLYEPDLREDEPDPEEFP